MTEHACDHEDLTQLHDMTSHVCTCCGLEGFLTNEGTFLSWERVERLIEEAKNKGEL